ncbi:hypothetical protein M092_0618 [Parabacteroides distasonis str. 3776 D15 iv]|uniref:Uncharacterized protein n=1 Tax=Parabacteroides distasonis str. 3776 D15 i TaxID=1339342 RepID=A0AB34LC69_PARDI|nr:hypothetical protein M091_0647 [Parabacteroides distasonis str. 3776 D15 i]KDS73603.1 hypothetical protein M092_0618 [Parabacteroides distasonis str. 3776 D15 iv]
MQLSTRTSPIVSPALSCVNISEGHTRTHFPHLMQLSWSMFSVILFLLLISKIKTPATIKITGVYI